MTYIEFKEKYKKQVFGLIDVLRPWSLKNPNDDNDNYIDLGWRLYISGKEPLRVWRDANNPKEVSFSFEGAQDAKNFLSDLQKAIEYCEVNP